jgi:hypothetical protein
MVVMKFVGGKEKDEELFKWLYVAFNSGFSSTQPDEINRMLDIVGKFDEVSAPKAGDAWPYMEEARPLKRGSQEIRLTASEVRLIETAVQASMGKFLPTFSKKYLVPVREFIRDAPNAPATTEERSKKKT